MGESKLIKISILCSVIGLLMLLIISETISLKDSDISSIDSSKLENKVKIKGVIKRATNKDTISVLNVEDYTGNITVTAFTPNYNFTKNEVIEVEGIVKDFQDQVQVDALKIKCF
ncbi:MAG: OB-fold nucleic acid binding domain-containing protein [Candidatus Nanoarchaeia archaeon]|nr:OB-fold nucleic acid binding domain-containing protein [Candidatus Nanoarchaeia archaeon]